MAVRVPSERANASDPADGVDPDAGRSGGPVRQPGSSTVDGVTGVGASASIGSRDRRLRNSLPNIDSLLLKNAPGGGQEVLPIGVFEVEDRVQRPVEGGG